MLANPWIVGPEPESVLTYGDEPDQIIEFFGTSGPIVVSIHGGYWRSIHNREHMRALAAKIASSGFQVANIEYRREALAPEKTFNDIKDALNKLSNPIAVIGFSVGGQLALIGAHDTGLIEKLILLAPITDLQRTKRESLGESAVTAFFGEQDLSSFDPLQRNYKSTIHIIHGDADSRVPIEHSRDFVKLKGGTLNELPGIDHFGVIDPNGRAFEEVLKILTKL